MSTSTSLQKDSFKINNDIIVNGLQTIFNNHLNQILVDIASTHSLELDTLYDKYITNNSINMDLNSVFQKKRPRKKNKIVSKVELCMARKADSCQCTRRRKDNTQYCGKHSGVLKFGRIDDEDKYSNTDQFIQCKPMQINGTDYLIDANRVVYTHNVDNPSIVGKLNDSGELILLTPNVQVNTLVA